MPDTSINTNVIKIDGIVSKDEEKLLQNLNEQYICECAENKTVCQTQLALLQEFIGSDLDQHTMAELEKSSPVELQSVSDHISDVIKNNQISLEVTELYQASLKISDPYTKYMLLVLALAGIMCPDQTCLQDCVQKIQFSTDNFSLDILDILMIKTILPDDQQSAWDEIKDTGAWKKLEYTKSTWHGVINIDLWQQLLQQYNLYNEQKTDNNHHIPIDPKKPKKPY